MCCQLLCYKHPIVEGLTFYHLFVHVCKGTSVKLFVSSKFRKFLSQYQQIFPDIF